MMGHLANLDPTNPTRNPADGTMEYRLDGEFLEARFKAEDDLFRYMATDVSSVREGIGSLVTTFASSQKRIERMGETLADSKATRSRNKLAKQARSAQAD